MPSLPPCIQHPFQLSSFGFIEDLMLQSHHFFISSLYLLDGHFSKESFEIGPDLNFKCDFKKVLNSLCLVLAARLSVRMRYQNRLRLEIRDFYQNRIYVSINHRFEFLKNDLTNFWPS